LGRKVISAGSLSKAKSTMSRVSRSMKESRDIARAEDTVEAIQMRLQQLESDFRSDTATLAAKMDPLTEQFEQISVCPAKADISIELVALGWLPYWQDFDDKLIPAW